jgi:geranylgeranyl diphosphate synthase, type I
VSTPAGDPVAPLRPRVQHILDGFLADQREVLAEMGAELEALVAAAADLLRGGKRLRPAFCYWGWRGAGRDDADPIVAVGAALELFQAAALVHDDLIDGSDTRRGMPAAHRRFASLHAAAGWVGDAAQFGTAAAVLLGDLLFGWSDELVSGCGLDPAALHRARAEYERMRTEVGAGQYLDILAQAAGPSRPADRVDRARRVIRYKAARYSVERPLLLGGRAGGAGPDLLAAYSDYGLALGAAFQLRDDVLGVFGDPGQTGKPAGDDLREGKQTLLVAFALERADREAAATVDRLLGDPALDSAGVAELRRIIVDTGALARVEAEVAEQVDRARSALARAEVTAEAGQALHALITAATTRTT